MSKEIETEIFDFSLPLEIMVHAGKISRRCIEDKENMGVRKYIIPG